jgi:hypothetical protein
MWNSNIVFVFTAGLVILMIKLTQVEKLELEKQTPNVKASIA